MKAILSISVFVLLIPLAGSAQYKSYKISPKGDTIDIIDQANRKQGPWVIHVDALRGEPGYEEEGYFVNNKKQGTWRKYSLQGDFIALENYLNGDKDGKSQYFNPFGGLLREEGWRAYNPDKPYDTIAVYGENNNEILEYKIVKAEPYSVKNGLWTWYDPQTGDVIKTEEYDRGRLLRQSLSEGEPIAQDSAVAPATDVKPQEVIEYEKKNSKKKKVKIRDGRTIY